MLREEVLADAVIGEAEMATRAVEKCRKRQTSVDYYDNTFKRSKMGNSNNNNDSNNTINNNNNNNEFRITMTKTTKTTRSNSSNNNNNNSL